LCKFGQCGDGIGTTVVFVDADEDVFWAEIVDEPEHGISPMTSNEVGIDDVGCDEYFVRIGISTSGSR